MTLIEEARRRQRRRRIALLVLAVVIAATTVALVHRDATRPRRHGEPRAARYVVENTPGGAIVTLRSVDPRTGEPATVATSVVLDPHRKAGLTTVQVDPVTGTVIATTYPRP